MTERFRERVRVKGEGTREYCMTEYLHDGIFSMREHLEYDDRVMGKPDPEECRNSVTECGRARKYYG